MIGPHGNLTCAEKLAESQLNLAHVSKNKCDNMQKNTKTKTNVSEYDILCFRVRPIISE